MKFRIFVMCCLLLAGAPAARAAVIGYVPMDDRPVNLEYVADTARAAGETIVTPSVSAIAGRQRPGSVSRLWDWVFEQAAVSDAMALSADSLVYGGLVASRTHFDSDAELSARLEKFRELKRRYPALRLYVFSTIMRTPKMSAGATEPPYYEKLGPAIFRITALEDKLEVAGLSAAETAELSSLIGAVPAENLAHFGVKVLSGHGRPPVQW